MDANYIYSVFTQVFAIFQPAMAVLVGVVVCIAVVRWVLRALSGG